MAGKSPQPKASEKVGSNNLRRLAPPLAFLAALCLMVVCFYDSGYTSLPPTGKRYDLAKASIDTLRQDEKRSGQREPWENLAAEFRAIYDADPGWPNRPAALFRAAESLEELARRSFAKADAKKAIECYEAVAQRHADSRLADDALFRAAKLRAAWLKDDKGALALLERIKSQYPKGDMITEAQALEKTLQAAANGRTAPEARQVSSTDGKEPKDEALPSKAAATAAPTSGTQSAPPADATPTQISRAGVQQPLPQAELLPRYRDAKAKMEALRADKVRSCWRQPWEELTTEFLRIYLSRKDWAISPGALFRAATSQEALSDCSHLADEYRQARDLYLKLAQEFPKSALADDAMGGALPSLEDLDLWVDEEGGVLGTDVLHREEGSLEEDALDARACEVGTTRVGRLEDRRAACAEVVHALGEGRRKPGGGAATSELDTGDIHALAVLVGGGVVEEAVDVRVHETGGHPLARRVDDVTLGTVRGERAELPVDDRQVAWAEDPARQYEPLREDRDGCHG